MIADRNLPQISLGGSSWFKHLRDAWIQDSHGEDDTPSGSEMETRCSYKCGPLAIELLASKVGLRKIADFHIALRRTVQEFFTETIPDIWSGDPDAWHDPFLETFGISNDFYEMCREHKTNGFEFEAPDEAWYIPD